MRCKAGHDHEALKASPLWATLPHPPGGGIQHVEATDDEPAAEVEMRNCACGSTLAIWRDLPRA